MIHEHETHQEGSECRAHDVGEIQVTEAGPRSTVRRHGNVGEQREHSTHETSRERHQRQRRHVVRGARGKCHEGDQHESGDTGCEHQYADDAEIRQGVLGSGRVTANHLREQRPERDSYQVCSQQHGKRVCLPGQDKVVGAVPEDLVRKRDASRPASQAQGNREGQQGRGFQPGPLWLHSGCRRFRTAGEEVRR